MIYFRRFVRNTMKMITLKVNIEDEVYANMFAELISNFTFVKSVEVPHLKNNLKSRLSNENLVTPAQNIGELSDYRGIWADKDITDLKKFRDNLWQRSK